MLRKTVNARMKLTEEELDILKDSIATKMLELIEKKNDKINPIKREYEEEIAEKEREIEDLRERCDSACQELIGEINDKIQALDALLNKLGGKSNGDNITTKEKSLEHSSDGNLDTPHLRRFSSCR